LHALPDSLPDYQYVTFLDGITGDGMVNINTRDMLIWDDILRTPGLLTQATIDKIFTSGKTNKGEIIDYGFGWGLNSKEGFERIAEHSGSWPGYTSYVLRFLDRGRTIVIFSNNEYMFIENMAHGIANILE
jgi:CubicO group peptidase (beta-lactamase class C family)